VVILGLYYSFLSALIVVYSIQYCGSVAFSSPAI
jgi:hypothetical protein